MFRKIMIITGWIVLIASIAFIVVFASQELSDVRCQSVVVQIEKGSPRFINESEIEDHVKKEGDIIFGRKLSGINTEFLELKLKKFSTLKNVEIYRKITVEALKFSGHLIIDVEERSPIVRIKAPDDDYYMDGDGVSIPLSKTYTEKVPVITGNVSKKTVQNKLLAMAGFINDDPFWKAQVEQIYVRSDDDLIVVPQIGDQIIEFGSSDDFKIKFRNLKAVYQQGFKYSGWEKYKILNVRYNNQVVCVKK